MFSLFARQPAAARRASQMLARHVSSVAGLPSQFDVSLSTNSSSLARQVTGSHLRVVDERVVDLFIYGEARPGDYVKVFSGLNKKNAQVLALSAHSIDLQFL